MGYTKVREDLTKLQNSCWTPDIYDLETLEYIDQAAIIRTS